MLEQDSGGVYYVLYRHKRDHRVEYWAALQASLDGSSAMRIRATQNALHPEWDEVPLKFTVDGGTMDYERFVELYERVEGEDGTG